MIMKLKEKSRSRVETNFIRLVGKCEELASNVYSTNNEDNWRLEKYTESLEQMLNDIRTGPNQPDRDTLAEYGKRVDFIKGIIDTSRLPTLSERVAASEQMKSGSNLQLGSHSISEVTSSASSSFGHTTTTMEIKHRHKTKYGEELRNELFGHDNNRKDSGRSGSLGGSDSFQTKPEDLDELLKFHKNMQEKIADHMLDLTKSLKEQVSLAGQIIKKDTEIIEKSGRILDANQGTLKVETEKLETFNKRACKCWMWFMLVIVCSTFIVMVLFMRLFKKRVVVPSA